MDGASFDRLSVIVHRLRDQSTRRGALRLLLGGSLATAGTLVGAETEAKKKKKHKNCRGYGGRCNGNKNCCNGRCINGFCFPRGGGGGGGGGKNCGGQRCPNGWRCCRQSGIDICVPNNYPTCCNGNGYNDGYRCCGGNGGACPSGWRCCGGFNQCCQPGWKCCGNGRCCPDGWYCGDIACYANQDAEASVESTSSVPFADPTTIDDGDWIDLSQR
jgi:hypothetical protein